MKQTILLTGATGQLGSCLARAFLEQGYQLKVLIRTKGSNSESRLKRVFETIHTTSSITTYSLSNRLEVLSGDITERYLGLSPRTLLRLANEVTDIVHCAAMVSFDPRKAAQLHQVNVEGTRNVLEFARMMNSVVLHYMSTAFVAGRSRGLIRESDLDSRTEFNNGYEESKFLAEVEVRKVATEGLPVVIYRPGILVGNSQTGHTQSFFGLYTLLKGLALVAQRARYTLKRRPTHPDARGLSLDNERVKIPLRVAGSESKTLNIVPIDYVVRLILAAFQDAENQGQTFHLVSSSPPTIGQLRGWMCLALGMHGVSLVDRSEFERKPMNRWERFFAKSTEEYAPYLGGQEPVFLSENIQRIARREEIPRPLINSEFIRLLTAYCLESRWGKRPVKVAAAKSLPPLPR